MRILLATWDGAGNLPPILALVTALVRRGHEVNALAHDVQRAALEGAGALFIRFTETPQLDLALPRPPSLDLSAWFSVFSPPAAIDALAAAARLTPDVILLDCMMPDALRASKAAGYRTVALVHGAFSAHAPWREPIDAADLALGFSYAAFDRGATFPSNLVFVGPLRPAVDAAPWIRRMPDRPLVVATLSSGLQGPPGTQAALLQRICDALAALDIEALVTTGRGLAPESLRVGANTTVERQVHHELVLRQAGLFITHAGHGSIMAALRSGAPMLCLPPFADQPHNAALVAAAGLGEILDPLTDPATIRAAVLRMLGDDALAARARHFALTVGTEPDPSDAADRIEALIA
jgi:UDP:flavonoid glycosyltransferase YjiC (YdhE family)